MLSRRLQRKGYSVVIATDGEQGVAMALITNKPERFVAPLLEHNPGEILNTFGEDGWELVQVLTGPDGNGLVAYLKREKA